MPVNVGHVQYEDALEGWQRIRDVLAGERAVKRAGEKYVPRLDSQTAEEFRAYVDRGLFYNATYRTLCGFIGMIFRRDPVLQLPDKSAALHPALKAFVNDVDLLGTPLDSYAKNLIADVVALGRAGTLVDWQGGRENRAYASMYAAESILNWRQTRIDGQLKLTLVVLSETAAGEPKDEDPFVAEEVAQLRVLKLVPSTDANSGRVTHSYEVEIWQLRPSKGRRKEMTWQLVRTVTPLRLGRPLSSIPFIFHGASHSRPDVEKSPIEDLVAANLDHYRLNVDYKHGMHFTALPTAFVTGFDKTAQLRVGSTTAWVTETPGATAGFLEFTGQGLSTFERAMDRDERLLAVLGSRLLEGQKKVGETAQAIELRQSGENSILGNIAVNVSASVTQTLRWAFWWNSTEESPDDVTNEQVLVELNTDFSTKGLSAQEIQAIVAAWQSGAISRDTMTDLFRRGEVLPEGRSTEEEERLISRERNGSGASGVSLFGGTG